MQFHIADTFTDALARLPAQEQKAAKTSAFDLQLNPAAPGLNLHRIEASKDQNFWSLRVSRELRIIVHRTGDSMLLAYVDRHDEAYAWARRRRIEAHPRTGAIQIVEVRERVEEIAPVTPSQSTRVLTGPRCFESLSRDELLCVGVPEDWIGDVLAADEDGFLALADHLPPEAAEALLEYISTGVLPKPAETVDAAYAHPDTRRRIRSIENALELQTALDFPWDKWTVYLHPSQRETIERSFSGPARVAGAAGTGKTVVALHRAARLANQSAEACVLLTTFSRPLALKLERKLALIVDPESPAAHRLTVAPFHGVAADLFEQVTGRRPPIASIDLVGGLLAQAAKATGATDFPLRFLVSEWSNVVDAWQIESEEAYGRAPRLGQKNRVGLRQRAWLWAVFDATREALAQRGMATSASILRDLAEHYGRLPDKPFTNIVIDEAQDLGPPALRFLAAIAPARPDSLFFTGDLGQRIFQQPFSWRDLGIDVRGRSLVLKVNYRTSHQIREAADRLLPKMLQDVDGLEEDRASTVSAFNGPQPLINRFRNTTEEIAGVGAWIRAARTSGLEPEEIGVFVRSHEQLDRALAAVKVAGETACELSDGEEEARAQIAVGTMHFAKGLEFKAVAVMACDEDVLPLKARLDAATDEVERAEVNATERQLFYVACTRARDRLLVTGAAPASAFLKDIGQQPSL
ncbi:MAG TPA: 3'-5' exonuclease [Rhizomicrobium sp.]|jgi:hypothetical protein